MTLAKIGRSMKNLAIIACPCAQQGAAAGAGVAGAAAGALAGGHVDWLHDAARHRALDAAHDHAVLGLEPASDDPQPAVDHLSGLHGALLDDVLVVDDEHIAPLLAVAERAVGHQQRLDVALRRHPYAHEQPRQQHGLLVLEQRSDRKRAGALVEIGRDVVDDALVRKSRLRLRSDLDRDRAQVLQRQPLFAQLLADLEYLLLVDVEVHVDRIDLDDGGELRWRAGADESTRVDQSRRDDAREWRLDVGVGEIDLGLLHLALGLVERSARDGVRGASAGQCAARARGDRERQRAGVALRPHPVLSQPVLVLRLQRDPDARRESGCRLRRSARDRDDAGRRAAARRAGHRDRARRWLAELPRSHARCARCVRRSSATSRSPRRAALDRARSAHHDVAQIDALASCGFRSLSVGVQDFAEPVQDAIHRHQIGRSRRGGSSIAHAPPGFDDINIDIVYGCRGRPRRASPRRSTT